METTQLITTLGASVLLLLGVGWMLLRGFVSELKETRDRMNKSADGWDETCDLAAHIDRVVALLEPRVVRIEGYDFNKINGDLQAFSLRLGRLEADVASMNTTLSNVHGVTHETNGIVKELRERRRSERGEAS